MVQGKGSIICIIILSVLFLGCIWEVDAQRRPVIGVSDASKDGKNAAVPRSYIDAVLQAGGVPVVMPMMYDEEKVLELLNTMDGIIFAGGGDFDPAYYNERPIPQMGKINVPRDEFEMKLVRLAAERSIPILGICRGLQLINIAFGGSLYQDLPAQYYDRSIRHRQTQPSSESSHAVYVEDNTIFSTIVKERMLMVNSSHHQAIKKVAQGFRVAGKSPDEIVEVIEKVDGDNWILGVQFHPEARVMEDYTMRRIFQCFIDEAGSLEKPDRTLKTVSVPDSRIRHEPEPDPESALPPQIIYKSVIDTQFIYKFIRDTQYIHAPADTVYIEDTVFVSVPSVKYIQMPADTIYVSDTVFITTPEKVLPPASPSAQSTSDTLVYTPGTPDVVTTKSVAKAKKKEEKERAKKEKREAEEKQSQYQKEQIEKVKQQKKALKEKEKLEKKAKKEQVEKDKQLRQQQEKNEKSDK